MTRQKWIIVVALCIGSLLQGCVSTPIQPERASSFKPGHGFVVIRIVTNTATTNTQYGFDVNQWVNLNVSASDGSPYVLLPDAHGANNSTQIFTGMLPAGRYRLKSLASVASLENIRDEFDVRDAQFTNLGVLIYQPTGNHGFTLLRMPDVDLNEFLSRNYETLVQQARTTEVVSWSMPSETSASSVTLRQDRTAVIGDPLTTVVGTATVGVMQAIADRVSATEAIKAWQEAKEPTDRLRMAKGSTYSFNSVQELPTGEIIAGSNLGQVLLRDPAKGWVQIDTGHAQELTAVYAADASRILVGGEEGLLLSTVDGGRTWRRIQTPPNTGVVLAVSRHQQSWLLMSVHKGELVVNISNDPLSGSWQEIKREIVAKSPVWPVRPNWHYGAVISGDRYVVTTPSASLRVLDLTTLTWAPVETPKPLRALRRAGDGHLFGANFLVPPFRSADRGNTWQKIDADCSKVLDMSFASSELGYLLCFKTGAFAGSTRLYKTTSGGRQWETLVSETPVMAITVHASTDGQKLFYSGINGTVYFSPDGGSTWKIERPVFLQTKNVPAH